MANRKATGSKTRTRPTAGRKPRNAKKRAARSKAAAGEARSASSAASGDGPKATAAELAVKQRDISVS